MPDYPRPFEAGRLRPSSEGHAGGDEPWLTPSRSATRASDLDRIKKLAELRDTGAISAEEFETEKARVLRHPTQGSTTEEP
jgi:Short C-terminal domain